MKGHIRKRGNKYAIVVDLGRDHNGKRKQKWFSGYEKKKEAEKDLPRILSEINDGSYVEPSKMSIKEYLIEWLDKKEHEVKYGTLTQYKAYIENYIIPGIGHIKLTDLKSVSLQRFFTSLAKSDVKKISQKHIYSILRNAFNDGYDYGIHPEILRKIKSPNPGKTKLEIWNNEEVSSFLNAAQKSRYYLAFHLALTTGMRQGEILGLKWENIDFEQNTLSVTQQLKRIDKGYEISDELKTSSSHRTITLDEETITQLKKHKVLQNKEKLAAGPHYNDQDLVIATSLGNYVLPSNLNRTYWNLIKVIGIKRIRFHDLRHTHATLLLKEGIHPKVVQERLGHSSIQVTLDRYSHVLPNLQKEAAEKIGSSIFGLKSKMN